MWLTLVMRGKSRDNIQIEEELQYPNVVTKKYDVKSRLDLNDLLNKMKQEKIKDRKNSVLILSGAAAFAAIILLIFSF